MAPLSLFAHSQPACGRLALAFPECLRCGCAGARDLLKDGWHPPARVRRLIPPALSEQGRWANDEPVRTDQIALNRFVHS